MKGTPVNTPKQSLNILLDSNCLIFFITILKFKKMFLYLDFQLFLAFYFLHFVFQFIIILSIVFLIFLLFLFLIIILQDYSQEFIPFSFFFLILFYKVNYLYYILTYNHQFIWQQFFY